MMDLKYPRGPYSKDIVVPNYQNYSTWYTLWSIGLFREGCW